MHKDFPLPNSSVRNLERRDSKMPILAKFWGCRYSL